MSVTWKVLPCFKSGETEGSVAPDGPLVKWTLWVAESWSVNVIVVPGETVRLLGLKFCPVPAPWGIVIWAAPPEPLELPELEPLPLELEACDPEFEAVPAADEAEDEPQRE